MIITSVGHSQPNAKISATSNHNCKHTCSPNPVLPKLGCRGPLNHTKSDTIVFAECIFDEL